MSEVDAHAAEMALREIRRLCETKDASRSETLISIIKALVDVALAPVEEQVCHLSGHDETIDGLNSLTIRMG